MVDLSWAKWSNKLRTMSPPWTDNGKVDGMVSQCWELANLVMFSQAPIQIHKLCQHIMPFIPKFVLDQFRSVQPDLGYTWVQNGSKFVCSGCQVVPVLHQFTGHRAGYHAEMIMREMSMNNPHTKLTQRVRQVDMTSSKTCASVVQVSTYWQSYRTHGWKEQATANQSISPRVCPETDKCKSSNQWVGSSNETCTPTPSIYIYMYINQPHIIAA